MDSTTQQNSSESPNPKGSIPNDDQIDNKNVALKASATTKDIPEFGWSDYAERINGRFAMIGFTAVLLIELISQSSFLHWAGFIK